MKAKAAINIAYGIAISPIITNMVINPTTSPLVIFCARFYAARKATSSSFSSLHVDVELEFLRRAHRGQDERLECITAGEILRRLVVQQHALGFLSVAWVERTIL